jgi:sugar/nucleoside kinase (ribokinase family)
VEEFADHRSHSKHNSREGDLIWYARSVSAGRALAATRRIAPDRLTSPLERVKRTMQFDYTTVGHVTIDALADGTRRAGGAAFYSALQAARLGQRAQIVTKGIAREIEELLEPYRDELALRVLPASATTTLATQGAGAERSQRVLAWAGMIEPQLELDTAIVHLAPVAREIPTSWRAPGAFVGLTPQGLARRWSALGAEFTPAAPTAQAGALAAGTDAVVLSELERSSCASLIERARAGGALVAITDGPRPCTIMLAGETTHVEVPTVEDPVEDLGAGDVFAAALFVSLAAGGAPQQAARFATAAAAIRMRGFGAGGVGDRASIEQRLAATGHAPG